MLSGVAIHFNDSMLIGRARRAKEEACMLDVSKSVNQYRRVNRPTNRADNPSRPEEWTSQ